MTGDEKMAGEAKKLKMDHGVSDKTADFSPPIVKSGEGTKGVCEDCKVYKTAKENLTLENSELRGENEKLRGFIKDLLVETGRNPDHLDHILTSYKKTKNLDKDTEKNWAVQKALSTSVVLRKLFGYFDDLSLLQFRIVCSFWAEEASACLLIFNVSAIDRMRPKLSRVQVRLSYNPVENTLGKNGVGVLKNLVELMTDGVKAGRKFPCSHFSLTCPNLLPTAAELPAVHVELLEKFGHLVESLDLEFVVGSNFASLSIRDIVESLRNLLFKWAPNLKRFRFDMQQWPSDEVQVGLLNEGSSDSLPNLEVLDWHNSWGSPAPQERRIYTDIARIAPNLKKIPVDYIKAAIEAKKTDTIKEIQIFFASASPSASAKLALQSEHCFNVEQIKVHYRLSEAYDENTKLFSYPEEWRSNVQLLNTLLRNNRNSLKKIESPNFGPLTEIGLEIPVMPNLKTLDVTTEYAEKHLRAENLAIDHFFRIFPKGLDVATTFPKLAHISWKIDINKEWFSFVDYSDIFLRLPILDTMGPLTSVRSLTFTTRDIPYLGFLQQIAPCLPNLRVLKVDYSEKFKTLIGAEKANFKPALPEILRLIWKFFPGIEEVQLILYLNDIPEGVFLKDSPVQLVDSVVTGLDLVTVKNLAGNRPDNNDFGEASGFSTQGSESPSILNMKNLRYLKFSIESENDSPIFTHVSGTHGFGLMSNLVVVIEAKGEKSAVIDDPKGLMSKNVKFNQIPRKQKSMW